MSCRDCGSINPAARGFRALLRRFRECCPSTFSERLLLENTKIRLKLALIRPWAFGEIMSVYAFAGNDNE